MESWSKEVSRRSPRDRRSRSTRFANTSTYQVAYYHQDNPGRNEFTSKMDLSSAKAEAEVLQAEGYTTQIINASDEEPEDAIDL